MHANFRNYGAMVLVVLSFCLKNELQAENSFLKDTTPKPQPQNQSVSPTSQGVCGINFPIFDNSCTASNEYDILISGITPIQLGTDVVLEEVRIIIEHSWDSDLDISLKSPNDKIIELSTDNGGGADNYGDPTDINCSNFTTFSMGGCQSVTEGIAPFIGTYIPEGDFDDFHDGSDPNGTWVLQLCDDAASDVGTLIFVELVFSEIICVAPTYLTIENFDSTSADILWISDDCTNTIIEYGDPGFVPGTGASAGEGTVVSVVCPVAQPYVLNGLLSETDYEIYVRTACPSGGFTKNSCSAIFKTDCTTDALTLIENFDAQTACATSCGTACEISGVWANIENDDFDWIVDADGTTSGSTGPPNDITGGGNYIYLEASGANCQNGNRADLVSNCLLIGANTEACHLSFYYHMYGATVNMLQLDISTDEGLNWTNLWSLSGNQGNSWERVFIDLGAYNNEIAKLRFSGFGGDDYSGDIALDQIEFYGTTELGDPSFIYYFDNDGDGFGDLNISLPACSDVPPNNYVENAADCDDENALVHPDAAEIPCNFIDENCNGMADDSILPDPVIADTDACFGLPMLLAGSGNLYWYDAAVGGNLLFSGNEFNTGTLTEDTVFYVIDSLNVDCKSERIAVNVTVHQNPEITSTDTPVICSGESFDLSGVNVIDLNNTGGILTFHDASPADVSNELLSSVVTPLTTQTFYILSTTGVGCTDELALEVFVNSSPQAVIDPTGISFLCKNGSQVLTASNEGDGLPPFAYEWSNGSSNTTIVIPANSPGVVDTVWFSITDANACKHVDSVFIETIESVTSASTTTSEVTSCGGNDGSITVTPLDGVPPYEISWSGPLAGMASNISGSFDIENLEQGAYSVHISDSDPFGLGCQMTIPIVIVNGPSAVIDTNIIITNATCVGETDGAIDISVSGNAPTFLWSNGATSEDISDVPAGFYNVTITDGICTNVIADIEIEEPEPFDFIANIVEVSCLGLNDGAIEIDVSGGAAPYTINWDNGASGAENNTLSAGDYAFSLTDASGCVFNSNPINVPEPEVLALEIIDQNNLSCFNQNDGNINISITGGTASYEFLWSHGAISEDVFQLNADEYTVTVTDTRGCVFISTPIAISQPTALSSTILTVENPSCNNLPDGRIDVEVLGGTQPYQFNWSNGDTTQNANNLAEGTYHLTVSDFNDCEIEINNIELVAPPVMTVNPEIIQNAFCDGVADGTIDISISGGTSPYFYNWSNGGNTEDLADLAAGDYQLTVSDDNGCSLESVVFTILESNTFATSVDEINGIDCHSNANGSIYLSTSGGLFPYDFIWSNGSETEDIENLIPGDYFATITDANGCLSYTDTFSISEPEVLNIEIISVENPSCNGFENGSIDVQVSGGTGNYVYNWNDGTATEDLSDVPSGLFQLTVQDENNCAIATEVIDVGEPEIIEITVESVVHVGCSGIDQGSIEIEVSGGVTPFEYEWSNGDLTQSISGVAAGYYAVTVTDFYGCVAILSSINVAQLNDGFDVDLTVVNDVSCFGAGDGSISISTSGGTPPFQYNWSNGATTAVNSNLPGGLYNVTLTDVNGCVGISPFVELQEPDELQYLLTDFGHNGCFYSNEGFLEIEVSGGIAPYDFLWSNEDTTQNLYNLVSGIYSLTITDANGCSTESSNPFEIEGPASDLSAVVVEQNDVSCFGFQDGSITISASGGVSPYNFEWNNGDSTATINQLAGGIYICQISDANGCITEAVVVEITEPESALMLDSVVVNDNFYCNDSTGSIALYLSGGTPDYYYNWNNGATTATISNLYEGGFECTVTDANGCFLNTEMFIINSPLDELLLDGESTPENIGFADGTATVTANGGIPPYEYLWDDEAAQTDSTAVGLEAGIYEVTVTDARGCSSVITVEVGSITDVQQVDWLETFALFPNPTSSSALLEMEFSKKVNAKIEVYSTLGQRVFVIEEKGKAINQQIDFSKHPAGVYFLKVILDGKQNFSHRIVFTP